jgi:hypothetical protein
MYLMFPKTGSRASLKSSQGKESEVTLAVLREVLFYAQLTFDEDDMLLIFLMLLIFFAPVWFSKLPILVFLGELLRMISDFRRSIYN